MQFVTFDIKQNNTTDLNRFLRSHRILSTSKVFNQLDGSWSFCIEYLSDENFQKENPVLAAEKAAKKKKKEQPKDEQ